MSNYKPIKEVIVFETNLSLIDYLLKRCIAGLFLTIIINTSLTIIFKLNWYAVLFSIMIYFFMMIFFYYYGGGNKIFKYKI